MIKCCALRRCAIFPKPLWRTGLVTLPPLRVLSSSMFCYEVQYSLPSRPVDSLYLRGRSWRVRVNSSSDLSARNKCVFPGCTARTNGDAIFCWEQPRSRRIGNDTGPLHDSGPEWATPAVEISRDVFAEFLPFGKTTLAFELRRSDAVRSWFLSPLALTLPSRKLPLCTARTSRRSTRSGCCVKVQWMFKTTEMWHPMLSPGWCFTSDPRNPCRETKWRN